MAVNICPICSGEIMKYRRFQKETGASRISVCQCCGARLRRRRGAALFLVLFILGVSVVLAHAAFRLLHSTGASLGTAALLVALAGGAGAALYGLGKRLLGWVPLDGTRLGGYSLVKHD